MEMYEKCPRKNVSCISKRHFKRLAAQRTHIISNLLLPLKPSSFHNINDICKNDSNNNSDNNSDNDSNIICNDINKNSIQYEYYDHKEQIDKYKSDSQQLVATFLVRTNRQPV